MRPTNFGCGIMHSLCRSARNLFSVRDFISPFRSSPTHSVLNDAVHAYMEEIGDVHHDDVMRAFFRSRVADVGKLIKKVVRVARRAPPEQTMDLDKLLPETNRIVLVRPGTFWHLNKLY